MSEYQTPFYDTYSIDSIHPYSLDIPEIITNLSRDISRNATLLIRFVMLLQKEGAQMDNFEYKIKRITIKLQNQFRLLETHQQTDQDEYDTVSSELDDALLEKDALNINRRLNAICEEEYAIKISLANWRVEDLSVKKAYLENSLRAIEEFKSLVVIRDIVDLYQVSKNDFNSLICLDLDPYTYGVLTSMLSKILETVRYSNPSTL